MVTINPKHQRFTAINEMNIFDQSDRNRRVIHIYNDKYVPQIYDYN